MEDTQGHFALGRCRGRPAQRVDRTFRAVHPDKHRTPLPRHAGQPAVMQLVPAALLRSPADHHDGTGRHVHAGVADGARHKAAQASRAPRADHEHPRVGSRVEQGVDRVGAPGLLDDRDGWRGGADALDGFVQELLGGSLELVGVV